MSDLVQVGIIGDYDPERPSHKATDEALRHCAIRLGIGLKFRWLPTEALERDADQSIGHFDGFFCAPGSPYKSKKGALNAIRFARENGYPFLGTCGGFQHAVIEYAQNELGLTDARHAEDDPGESNLFITALSCSLMGETRKIRISPGSRAYQIYGQAEVEERYNCNFGLNPGYQELLDRHGFKVAGTDGNGEARILELPKSRFYIATLFQPQLSSSPLNPHKLMVAFLDCCRK